MLVEVELRSPGVLQRSSTPRAKAGRTGGGDPEPRTSSTAIGCGSEHLRSMRAKGLVLEGPDKENKHKGGASRHMDNILFLLARNSAAGAPRSRSVDNGLWPAGAPRSLAVDNGLWPESAARSLVGQLRGSVERLKKLSMDLSEGELLSGGIAIGA